MKLITNPTYIDCLKSSLGTQFDGLVFLKEKWGLHVILVNPFGFYITQEQRKRFKEILKASRKLRCLSSQITENPLSPFSMEEKNLLKNYDFKPYQTFTHILFLGNTFEETIKKASKRRKWEMKKYINSPWQRILFVKIGYDLELLRDFYKLYTAEAMNRWKLKKIPYNNQLLECFIRNNLIKVFSVYEKNTNELVASAIFMEDTDSAFYWLAITDIKLSKRISSKVKIYPTSILWASIINYYITKGKRYINLGSSEGLPKVAKFKETLGGVKKEYSIWRLRRFGL